MLGPLFYIIYANDLAVVLKNSEIALYAGDTVLYTANPNFCDSVSKLQDLASWCEDTGVSVNTDKTKIMLFGSQHQIGALLDFNVDYNGKP